MPWTSHFERVRFGARMAIVPCASSNINASFTDVRLRPRIITPRTGPTLTANKPRRSPRAGSSCFTPAELRGPREFSGGRDPGHALAAATEPNVTLLLAAGHRGGIGPKIDRTRCALRHRPCSWTGNRSSPLRSAGETTQQSVRPARSRRLQILPASSRAYRRAVQERHRESAH